MIYVKNLSEKPIGFGTMVLMPDHAGQLPAGFDENHPTVAFFLRKKFLVIVDAAAEAERAALEAKEEAERKAADAAEAQKEAAEALAKAKTAEIEAQIRDISRMNLQPLRELAKKHNLEFADNDTVAVLREKLTAHLQAQ